MRSPDLKRNSRYCLEPWSLVLPWDLELGVQRDWMHNIKYNRDPLVDLKLKTSLNTFL
jgi:hypothetical protein